MKANSRWFITGLACVLVLIALAAFKFFQIKAAIAYGKSFPEPSESVLAVEAVVSDVEKTISAIGVIIAPQALELRNEVEGQIAVLNVTSGSVVKQGQILLQFDVSEETARLQAAKARVNLAKLDLDRNRRLRLQKTVSEESLDQSEADYAIAQADVMALDAIIAKKTLRAPFDAVAGLHNFEVGDFLQSNTDIVSLVGINNFSWVDFDVPLARADIAVGTLVTVVLSPQQADGIPATVIAKSPMASASSRNIRVRARIDNPVALPPNSVVRVLVPVSHSSQVIVPRTALMIDVAGDYVFVLKKNSQGESYRAERRAVTLGYKGDQSAAIVEGVKAGELIAAQGAFKLYPGILTFVGRRPADAVSADPTRAESASSEE